MRFMVIIPHHWCRQELVSSIQFVLRCEQFQLQGDPTVLLMNTIIQQAKILENGHLAQNVQETWWHAHQRCPPSARQCTNSYVIQMKACSWRDKRVFIGGTSSSAASRITVENSCGGQYFRRTAHFEPTSNTVLTYPDLYYYVRTNKIKI